MACRCFQSAANFLAFEARLMELRKSAEWAWDRGTGDMPAAIAIVGLLV
jgi:hypothetical protein